MHAISIKYNDGRIKNLPILIRGSKHPLKHVTFSNLKAARKSDSTFSKTGVLHFNVFDDVMDAQLVRAYLNEILPQSNDEQAEKSSYTVTIDETHEIAQFLIAQLRHQIGDSAQKYRFKITASRIHQYDKDKLQFSTHTAEAVITLEPILPNLFAILKQEPKCSELFNIISSNAVFAEIIEPDTRDTSCADKTHKVKSQILDSEQVAIYLDNTENNATIPTLMGDSVEDAAFQKFIPELFAAYQANKKNILLALKDYNQKYSKIDVHTDTDMNVNRNYSRENFPILIKKILYYSDIDSNVMLDMLKDVFERVNKICGIDYKLLDMLLNNNSDNQQIIINNFEDIQQNIAIFVNILNYLYPLIHIAEEDKSNPAAILNTIENACNIQNQVIHTPKNENLFSGILGNINLVKLILQNKQTILCVLSATYPHLKIADDISNPDLLQVIYADPEILHENENNQIALTMEMYSFQAIMELYEAHKNDVLEFMQTFYGTENFNFNEADTPDIFKQKIIQLIKNASNNGLSFKDLLDCLDITMEMNTTFAQIIQGADNNLLKNMISTIYPHAVLSDAIDFNEVMHVIKQNNGEFLEDIKKMQDRYLNIVEPYHLASQAMILSYLYPSIILSPLPTLQEFIAAIHQAVELESVSDAGTDEDIAKDFDSVVEKIHSMLHKFNWVTTMPTNAKLAIDYMYPKHDLANNPNIAKMIDYLNNQITSENEYDACNVKFRMAEQVAINIGILTSTKKTNFLLTLMQVYPQYTISNNLELFNVIDAHITDENCIQIAKDVAKQCHIPFENVLEKLAQDVGVINIIEEYSTEEPEKARRFLADLTTVYHRYFEVKDVDFSTINPEDYQAIIAAMYKARTLLTQAKNNAKLKNLNLYNMWRHVHDFKKNSKNFLFQNMTQDDFNSNGLLYIGLAESVEGSHLRNIQNNIKAPPLVAKNINYLSAAPEYAQGSNDYFRISIQIDAPI
jgi:hypothetical protein